jgi:glutathione S-transferase
VNADQATSGRYRLWGSPHSLYTGKIRSYLIKKGVPYRELTPNDPRFGSVVVPSVRHMVLPVLEAADGRMLQDTTDMIDFIEARHAAPAMIPPTPVQRVVAWLVGAYGSEGLLPVAMHYRWSYRAQQEEFLCTEFGRPLYNGPDRAARRAAGARLMAYFSSFLPTLGIYPETIPAVEASYREFLDALDAHFQCHPYVLGGHPSIADFGLMAPLYAHLARDPVPATLMKNVAPNVFRWTERMNLPGIADGEFPAAPEAYPGGDAIPESLEPVLRLIFQDWGPELAANTALYNDWVTRDPGLPAGHMVSAGGERKVHPTLGAIEYEWRGCKLRRASAPQTLWHFERAAALARALEGDARGRFEALLARTGGEQVMATRLARQMKREDYVLVLA